jgi:hypothetical protein
MSRRTSRVAALGAAAALAVATGLSQAQSTGAEGFGDFLWDDLNQNGIQDAGEPGVNGVQVNLFSSSNNFAAPVATDTTHNSGNYLLNLGTTGNVSSNFFVQFGSLPTGFVFSPPHVGANGAVDSDVTGLHGAGTTDIIPGFNLPVSGGPLLTIDAGIFCPDTAECPRPAVPEPGTLATLALGLIAFASQLRRRRRT